MDVHGTDGRNRPGARRGNDDLDLRVGRNEASAFAMLLNCPKCGQKLSPNKDWRRPYGRECEHCGEPLRWKRSWESRFFMVLAIALWLWVQNRYFGGVTAHPAVNVVCVFIIGCISGWIGLKQTGWVSRREESVEHVADEKQLK